MIKKILVALDPDSDTPVATRYAVDIAQRTDAEVTGLAVVDMGSIEASTRGGGIGSMYYADKLRGNLTTEARTIAHELLAAFDEALVGDAVRHGEVVQEGVPFKRIVEDMNYHDLLVMGKDPHFFYSHPDKETNTLARVVKSTIGPTLVVGREYQSVKRVLIAFDGSRAAARTVRRFAHLQPFGTDLKIQIVHIYDDNRAESELALELVHSYLGAHSFQAQVVSMQGNNPGDQIVEYAEQYGADLVLAGAHSVSKIREVVFGSTTSALLKQCTVPLFLDS